MTAPDEDAGAVCDELDAFFDAFADGFEGATGYVATIDPPTLSNIAESYVHDVVRYKRFHEIDLPDRARRAAYLCKWITRLRPVSVQSVYRPGQGKPYLLANELFALYIVSGILRMDFEATFTTRMLNMLVYSMRYRASSEDTFILYFGHLCNLE